MRPERVYVIKLSRSSSAFASFRSTVSNASVNQTSTGARRSRASVVLRWEYHSRAKLVDVRNSNVHIRRSSGSALGKPYVILTAAIALGSIFS